MPAVVTPMADAADVAAAAGVAATAGMPRPAAMGVLEALAAMAVRLSPIPPTLMQTVATAGVAATDPSPRVAQAETVPPVVQAVSVATAEPVALGARLFSELLSS
jgi:hypothetical protein